MGIEHDARAIFRQKKEHQICTLYRPELLVFVLQYSQKPNGFCGATRDC
jgi:hypothetical protein